MFNRCVSETFKEVLVEISLDCGDLLLVCGFSSEWFEEESWLVHSLKKCSLKLNKLGSESWCNVEKGVCVW